MSFWKKVGEFFACPSSPAEETEEFAIQWFRETREEIVTPDSYYDELPRWALVAFAARNARRVADLLSVISPSQINEANKTVSVIETAASECESGMVPNPVNIPERLMGNRAVEICITTLNTAIDCLEIEDKTPLKSMVAAVENYCEAALGYGCGEVVRDSIRMYVRRDLLKLIKEGQGTDDSKPFSPDFFGPLWPEGYPAGWPGPK